MKKLLFLFFGFFVFFNIATISKAHAVSNPAKILETFNTEMIDDVSNKFLDKPFLRFDSEGSIVRFIFFACFLIALFSAIKDFGTPGMMPKLFELSIYSIIVLALLGEASSYGFMSKIGFKGSKQANSLDRDIYNYLKEGFDEAAKTVFKGEDSEKLWQVTLKSTVLTDRMIRAQGQCDYDEETEAAKQKKCFVDFITTGDHVFDKKSDVVGAAVSVATLGIAGLLSWLQEIGARILNPFTWFFPSLFWLVKLLTSVVNIFLVLGYGLASAVSLFFAKLVCPLLLLPSQRGAVIKGLKTPLSITLWGFLMQLVIFMSVVFTEALNKGAEKAALDAISNTSFDLVALGTILGAMIICQLVIMLFPLVAMFKIPKLAEDMLNLSVSSVISFGQDLIAATGGVAKMAAGLAMPAASMIGGAIGGAAGAASPALGKALGGIGGGLGSLGTKVLGENRMNSLKSGFGAASEKARDGISKAKSFRDKYSDISSGGSGDSGLSRASKESVNKSYSDFQNSRGSFDDAKSTKTGSKKGGGDSSSGGDGGSNRWASIRSAAASGASSLGNMAIDSVSGGPSGAARAFESSLGSGAAALGSGMVQSGQMMREGGEKLKNIQAHLLRSKESTPEQRRAAQAQVGQALAPKKELMGDSLKSYRSLEKRIQNGEALTAEDTETLTQLQNNNLTAEQSKLVGDATLQRYNQALAEAQESGDYEEAIKLANNSNANSELLKKDAINRQNMKGYSKARDEMNAKIYQLQDDAAGSTSKVKTIEAQANLAAMVSSGLASRSVFSDQYYDSSSMQVTTLQKQIADQKYAQSMTDIDNIVQKTNKTSVDYDNLKNLAESNKFSISNNLKQKKIENELNKAGINFNFKKSQNESLNLGTFADKYSTTQDFNIKKDNVIKINQQEFSFDSNGKVISGSFINQQGLNSDVSKLKPEDIKSIDDQISKYSDYLIKYNELQESSPQNAAQFNRRANSVRKHLSYLNEIKEAYNESKQEK